jgi:hypothetical protein
MNFFRNFLWSFGITLLISKLIGFRAVWRGIVNIAIFIAALVAFRLLAQVVHILLIQ